MIEITTPDDLVEINARLAAIEERLHDLEVGTPDPPEPPQPEPPEPEPPQPEPPEPEPPEPEPPEPEPPEPEPPQPEPRGTLISYALQTEDEVNSLHFIHGMPYGPDDERAFHYDPEIGGAKGRIIPAEKLCQLRRDSNWVLAPLNGRVYAEWQFYVPQSYYDLNWDEMLWDSIKTFRLYNIKKRGGFSDASGTLTMLRNEFWLRSEIEMRTGYLPPGDQWVTHRITKDFDKMKLEFKAIDNQGNVLFDGVESVPRLTPIDNIAATLHSTSRGHHGNGKNQSHETFFGYRNFKLVAE